MMHDGVDYMFFWVSDVSARLTDVVMTSQGVCVCGSDNTHSTIWSQNTEEIMKAVEH